MAQTSRPCEGCGATIHRTAPVAPIKHYCGPDCRPRCSIEGCEKPQHGNTYCSTHHTRWKKYGNPLAPILRQPNVGECSVDGCGRPSRKRGWCASHYAQWRRTGQVKPFLYKWGDGGYVSTHLWIRRNRGDATEHACVACGTSAAEWSYNGGHPGEVIDTAGRRYTRDFDAYSPRCVACHRLFDENPISMRNTSP